MLTSQRNRGARDLLGWSRADLGRRTSLELDVIDRAEERDGNAPLHCGQEIAIRRVCERAGVESVDHPPSARVDPDRPASA